MRSNLRWLLLGVVLLCGCSGGLPSPGPMPAGQSFAGWWNSSWGRMKLMQNGKKVFGPFSGVRNGSVSGRQEGDLFLFAWIQREGGQSGHGYLRMSPNGQQLEGRWGFIKSYDDGGTWSAQRLGKGADDSD